MWTHGLKARFLSFRLNRPSGDESEVLLTVSDWERVIARDAPEREGRPIVGVDLGAVERGALLSPCGATAG